MTNQIQLNLDPQSASWVTYPEDSSKVLSKDQGVSDSPIVGMILVPIIIWNHPARKKLTTPHFMAHTLWSVCLSESEQIYLLPVTGSLSDFFFFCNETSRTWASLGPETRWKPSFET